MTEIQFFYRKDSQQIDAVYRDCMSGSSKYVDGPIYTEVNVTDPPYEVTRDHKVILDGMGNVVDTEPDINPVQPVEPVVLPMCEHVAVITGADLTAVKPLNVTITYKGEDFPMSCFVSQDLKDAYDGGLLSIGDYVIVQFMENALDKPFASQKVFKTW